jgi:hypothetical protein
LNEPRSLIGGLNGSSKKRKIMGLPYNDSDCKKPGEVINFAIGNGLQ